MALKLAASIRGLSVAVLVIIASVAEAWSSERLPALPKSVHPDVVATDPALLKMWQRLKAERVELIARNKKLLDTCKGVEANTSLDRYCKAEDAAVQEVVWDHYLDCRHFLRRYSIALSELTVTEILNYTEKMKWPKSERDRLRRGFEKFSTFDDPKESVEQLAGIWAGITQRNGNAELERLADATKGFSATGAGIQSFNDCAVFALANAAGVPYGAAAAVATKFIANGKWRSPEERAQARKTVEERGLNAGEVLMVAEHFGQAEVLGTAQFDAVLKQSHPILVNVVPSSGNAWNGHQIVLTKVFKDGAQKWFQALDSNRSPVTKIYIKAEELDVLIKESGIAYVPEDNRAP